MNVREDFLNILQDYVEFPVNEIDSNEAFKNASGVDSFMLIELVSALEEHFGFSIPNYDIMEFKTIDDIVHYLEKRVNKS